jgi:alpha-beta hydrolase superfamily lysophospholipase
MSLTDRMTLDDTRTMSNTAELHPVDATESVRFSRSAPVPAYRASDGYLLRYRRWLSDLESPRGIVVGLHGIQSHSGWYAYSCGRLAEAGYDVYFLDRRGSGLNEESRGYAVHEDRLVNDVAQFLSAIRAQQRTTTKPAPVVLMGVSWGGKLASLVGGRRPDLVDALALLYPGLYSLVQPTRYQRFKLRAAERKGWGIYHIPIPLNEPELFTDEPQWQEFIRQDQLALHQVTVSFMAASLRMTEELEQQTRRLTMPVLMMQAGRDRIIDNRRCQQFFDRIASQRKTLLEYPEARHTLEFEPKPDQFIDDLLAWLAGVTEMSNAAT